MIRLVLLIFVGVWAGTPWHLWAQTPTPTLAESTAPATGLLPSVTPELSPPPRAHEKCRVRLWSLAGTYEQKLWVNVRSADQKETGTLYVKGLRSGLFGPYRESETGKKVWSVFAQNDSEPSDSATSPPLAESAEWKFEKDKSYTILLRTLDSGKLGFELWIDGLKPEQVRQLRVINLTKLKTSLTRYVGNKETIWNAELPVSESVWVPEGSATTGQYGILFQRPEKSPVHRMFQVDWKKTPAVTALLHEAEGEPSLLVAFDAQSESDDTEEGDQPQPVLTVPSKK